MYNARLAACSRSSSGEFIYATHQYIILRERERTYLEEESHNGRTSAASHVLHPQRTLRIDPPRYTSHLSYTEIHIPSSRHSLQASQLYFILVFSLRIAVSFLLFFLYCRSSSKSHRNLRIRSCVLQVLRIDPQISVDGNVLHILTGTFQHDILNLVLWLALAKQRDGVFLRGGEVEEFEEGKVPGF
jgi:hypothetical protein